MPKNTRRPLRILRVLSAKPSLFFTKTSGWLLVPVIGEEDFAFALVIGLGDHPFLFHALDQPGRAVVADDQAPLDVACRRPAFARNDGKRLVVQFVATRPRAAIAEYPVRIIAVVVLLFRHGVE